MRHGERDILISGASVAGPALAWWLARRGFRPVIVERAGQLRGGGYAVDFRGDVHLRVLRQMGLLEQVRARQTGLHSLTYVDEEGRPVASMPPVFFAGDVEVLRGDLAAIIYEATRNDTEYIFGDSVTGLEQDGSGVHVTFARTSPRTFDLVIGADGVHSNIRRLAFGPEDEFMHGLGLYVSIFTVPNFAGLDHSGLLHSVPGKTAGIFAAGDPDRAIAQLYFTAPDHHYQPHSDPRQEQETVAGQFGGLGWHVPQLLAEMSATTDFYFDTTSQICMDTWSNGRVALIGDAGYAAGPGGNGTGNAVVAAYILAGELAAANDHTAAFARYEQRLRQYVAGAQKQAAGSQAFLAPPTWKKIRQRDRFYKMLPYLPVSGLISRAAAKTATAITLPSYPRTGAAGG